MGLSSARVTQFMAAVVLAVALSGCSTMPGAMPHDDTMQVRLAVGQSVAGLRALVADLAAPAQPEPQIVDTAPPAMLIEQARIAVITEGAVQLDQPGLAAKAELATLTLVLTLCRERVRAANGLQAGSEAARDAARLIGQRCVAPLALMLS